MSITDTSPALTRRDLLQATAGAAGSLALKGGLAVPASAATPQLQTLADDGQGADGICLDAEGAIWASSGPRCVRIREGGEVLWEVGVPDSLMCFACMLGGDDGRTLFIVANAWGGDAPDAGGAPTGKVFATRVQVPHAGYP